MKQHKIYACRRPWYLCAPCMAWGAVYFTAYNTERMARGVLALFKRH